MLQEYFRTKIPDKSYSAIKGNRQGLFKIVATNEKLKNTNQYYIEN